MKETLEDAIDKRSHEMQLDTPAITREDPFQRSASLSPSLYHLQ